MRSLSLLCLLSAPDALALQLPASGALMRCSPPLVANSAVPASSRAPLSNVDMIASPFPPSLLRCIFGLGVIGAWVKNAWEKESEADRLYAKVHWAEPSDLSEDGCTLIGEEEGDDGKMWYACNGHGSDEGMECTRDESSFIKGMNEEDSLYLCKVPKVSKDKIE